MLFLARAVLVGCFNALVDTPVRIILTEMFVKTVYSRLEILPWKIYITNLKRESFVDACVSSCVYSA